MVENRPFLPISISTAHKLVPIQGVLTNKYVKKEMKKKRTFKTGFQKCLKKLLSFVGLGSFAFCFESA